MQLLSLLTLAALCQNELKAVATFVALYVKTILDLIHGWHTKGQGTYLGYCCTPLTSFTMKKKKLKKYTINKAQMEHNVFTYSVTDIFRKLNVSAITSICRATNIILWKVISL